MLHPTLNMHAKYELEGTYLVSMMEGMFISLPTALDIKLCLVTNGHLCMFDQALYPVECINWCIYALFINDKKQIKRNFLLKTLDQTTYLAYSLDGYLWAVSALAAKKLRVRCVMETHVITIKPPLQIMDIGNGCEAYSASIYIPAKSELMATLQSITRSQFFLEYNFNYTNVSNFLVWYKSDFAKLTNEEIKTLKAKVLKLPTMSMEIFDNVLENIDENYPLSLPPTFILALLAMVGVCVIALGIIFIWYKRKASPATSTIGNLTKLVPSLNDKIPTLDSLLPILSELISSKNQNKTIITPATVSKQSQTPPDELILPPVLVPQLQTDTTTPSTSAIDKPSCFVTTPKLNAKDIKSKPVSLEMFNKAVRNLNTEGIINLKKYNHFLTMKTSKPI